MSQRRRVLYSPVPITEEEDTLLPIKEADNKGDNAIIPKLIPTKLTRQAYERLNDLEFDPLELSVKIARGEALTTDHPLLPLLTDTLTGWIKRIKTNHDIDPDEIADFIATSERLLTDSWTSHELRSKHVLELLNYIYSKRKSVDLRASGDIRVDLGAKPLTKAEMEDFKDIFNKGY